MIRLLTLLLTLAVLIPGAAANDDKLAALIVDGQNNHKVWPTTTKMMKDYLEQTGLFSVDVATTRPDGSDPDFHPKFSNYDVVVSNYNGAPWPEETKKDFIQFVKDGGGLVIVHAADNAFGNWPEYNEMIGLGGWGGRSERSGPYVYVDSEGKTVIDKSAGRGGSHGRQHPFAIVVRERNHPITEGMPLEWMHAKDELYDSLRGPAKNMNVLATAYSDEGTNGSGRHEPMLMTIRYGEGRVFHTPMGHAEYSQECVGFITCLQRGTEWAATGEVTIPVPDDFPTEDSESSRTWEAGDN